MEIPINQQIFSTLAKSNRVLVALPEHASPDLIGSALAFQLFLKKLQKDAVVVSSAHMPEQLAFLPGYRDIQHAINSNGSLVVVLDTSVRELDELSYEEKDGRVEIFLKPKNSPFTPEDVTFKQDRSPADTIVLLGAKSLEDLGALFEHAPEAFYEAPKINIDIHPGNEYFGAINLVDINATSVAEVLSGLFADFEQQMVDEDIATCLLTGIIYRTNSFQHVQTTPQAFLRASQLISLGGRQQEVVKNLYKSKPLPLLRLWGRALARLKIEEEKFALYSLLNLSDFGKSGAHSEDLHAVMRELLDNITGYKMVALIAEMLGGGVRVLLALHNSVDVDGFFERMEVEMPEPDQLPVGQYRVYDIELPSMPLTDAESKFLYAISPMPIPNEQSA